MAVLSILLLLLAGSLGTVDEDQLPQLIAKHRGKIVVLNFWATWCGPCREEFPDLVRIYDERKKDLVVLSVSLDEPEDRDKVIAFLQEQKAQFPAYIEASRDFDAFVNAVHPQWSTAIPATFVYNRKGKRVFSRVGKITYEQLQKEIEKIGS